MEGIVEFFKNVPGKFNLQPYNIYHFFATGRLGILFLLGSASYNCFYNFLIPWIIKGKYEKKKQEID